MERALSRNLTVNALGLVARGAQLLPVLAVSRLLGAEAAGRLLLGLGLFEIAASVATTGFTDATTILASRHVDGARVALRRVVATALIAATAVALAIAGLAQVGLGPLTRALGADYAAIRPGLVLLAWALVPAAIARVCLATTTAFLRAEWEVFLGAAGVPLGLAAGLAWIGLRGGGEGEIFAAVLAVQTAIAVVGVALLARFVGLRSLFRGGLDRGVLRFAVPQGLHAAALTYLVRIDVVLLAWLRVPAGLVGWYGTAAMLAMELRQARMVFAAALGPIVARRAGDRAAVEAALSHAARWVVAISAPVALGFALLGGELLARLVPGERVGGLVCAVLILGPLANCAGGLASNFLVFLLHNRWNLANAVVAGLLKTGLVLALVPRHGLIGAAAATAVTMALLTVAENVELWRLERVRITWRRSR